MYRLRARRRYSAYCIGPNTYQAATNAVCGGGVDSFTTLGLGARGAAECEMETWYAL